jgi:hypothetical protein
MLVTSCQACNSPRGLERTITDESRIGQHMGQVDQGVVTRSTNEQCVAIIALASVAKLLLLKQGHSHMPIGCASVMNCITSMVVVTLCVCCCTPPAFGPAKITIHCWIFLS